MDDTKAMAVSATMVGLAALASGAILFLGPRANATDSVLPPPAEVIVEYVDAAGTRFDVPTTYETAMPATSSTR